MQRVLTYMKDDEHFRSSRQIEEGLPPSEVSLPNQTEWEQDLIYPRHDTYQVYCLLMLATFGYLTSDIVLLHRSRNRTEGHTARLTCDSTNVKLITL